MDFPKKQQQSLIPRYLLQYLQDLQISHTDPTAPWGGGGGGGSYTAGDGIDITNSVISIDNTVALKTDIPSLNGYATETWVTNQGYLVQSDLSDYVTSTELATELLNYAELSDLATVAISGDYNDLTNKPTIPTVPTNVSAFTNDSGYITSSALTGYATESWVTNQGYSTFSGSYNDLTNKPTIPDAVSGTNNGTNWTSLTIGSDTYGLASGGGSSYTAGDGIDITNDVISVDSNVVALKTDIPTATSDLTNDSGYITTGNLLRYVTTDTAQTISGAKNFTGLTTFQGTHYNVYFGQSTGFDVTDKNNPSKESMTIHPGFLSSQRDIGNTALDGNFFLGNHEFNIYNSDNEYKLGIKATRGGSTLLGEYTFKNKTGDVAITSEIPTATSDLTNDSGYITSSALSGYATESWVTNQGYSTFSGSYNDLTNKPTIPTDTSDLTNNAGYITSSALTGYATESWVTNQGYSTFSGSYNDLTNKPTIPDAVSGTNDGTYWTSLTIGSNTYSIGGGGSTPSNMVTTNTTQNITAVKTIYNTSNGHSDIYFKAPRNDSGSNTMGFSAFDYNNNQIGGLQIMNRTLQFNSDTGSTYYYGTFLTNFRDSPNALNTVTGFRVLPSDAYSGSHSINFVAPYGTETDLYNIYKSNSNVNTVNLVAAITNGTNTVLANKLGVVDISSLISGGGGGTTVSGTNNGTYWTSITIGADTYGIPSGGGGGGSATANLFLHNFRLAFTTSSGVTSYIEATILTKSSTQILTIAELASQVAALQATAYDDSVIGVIYGQWYRNNNPGRKETILGFGLTGSAGSPNLYMTVPNGNGPTGSVNFVSTATATQTIQWVNALMSASGLEVTAECTDVVTPSIL